MRICERRIFSKSFGGKFNPFEQRLLPERIKKIEHAYP